MRIFKLLAMATLLVGVLFTACKKDEDTLQSQQIMAAEDQTTANDLYEDVDEQVDEAIETRGGGGAACPTVTIDPADGSYPRTMTIDFGTDGCVGPDGRTRKGQIVVELTDTLTAAGAVRTATFVDFYVDDAHLEGTRTLINEGTDANGNRTFSRTVEGGKITFPNGDVATWEANHVMAQTEGGSTASLIDNVWEITGGAAGVTRNGKAYTTEIIDPLVKKRACPWTVSGSKTLTVATKTVTIDYGTGICDRKATVTLPNGTVKEILIRWWQ